MPNDPTSEIAARMRAADMPESAIRTFAFHVDRFLSGDSGALSRDQLIPVGSIADAGVPDGTGESDPHLLRRAAVIKLNGGLGTGMGLRRAKSLIEVRPGLSFLDLIVHQILALRERFDTNLPLLLMNSFRTAEETADALACYPELAQEGFPAGFLQHRVPKLLATNGSPVTWPAEPELEWCPPGHGDLYTALVTSGVLDTLLAAGIEFAFVSNSDNLGAVLDPRLLAHMVESGSDFMMEVADRTPADRKGGHLCRLADGRLALRESAQCPPAERDEFQDIGRYRYFNTNNLWFSLPALAELLDRHDGILPLATIVNRKHVDPRDADSPAVVQLETAMGAAISLFDHATAIRVPRRRFSPVKNTDDLLAVRSDAYEVTPDGLVVLAEHRSSPPTVRLDPRFHKHLEDFERRFPAGPPSLDGCDRLTVEGDVTFGEGVVVEGDVSIRGGDSPSRIPDGAVLRSEHRA
ncbi:MAG: UTP--glucose-1-phosphate uridylyltransferase [Thermoanaerobaculales bacterium]|jgi:UTP--glucose-1-phosphate uridylyltransferase|nr:UTP--glucose-1-phosphate uridylyltransferase [Thermoanaerobaculales bacterium]